MAVLCKVVVEEAGGRVTDAAGKALDFSLGRTLSDNQGVVATNGPLHHSVITVWRFNYFFVPR